MGYRYLQARGALNEVAPELAALPLGPADHLAARFVPVEVIELVPEAVARENLILPLAFDGETLTCAAVDPDNIALADKLRFLLNKNIRLVGAPREALIEGINYHYGRTKTESVDSYLQEFTDAALEEAQTGATASTRGAAPAARFKHAGRAAWARAPRIDLPRSSPSAGADTTAAIGGASMFFYVVEEGQRVLMRRPNGTLQVLVGPKRVWRGRKVFRPMQHHVAHPDSFLVVRYRDGRQEHLPGPVEIWFDPRIHREIVVEEALQLSAKEAVVVYSRAEASDAIARRIVYGPALFVPKPGEWLHTFSWHASQGGSQGAQKVAHALVFQKLWLLPDQMYHDVPDVRTADDAVLSIRLMIFFELVDIERMLETTHDPIGDFVNAATSDVVDFTGKHDFEQFKRNTDRLNELATYRQLTVRATQCGYRINKVVFRGYGAAAALQQMHDQAIQARTRLQLDRATEQQAQELENYKLDNQLARAGKRRGEQTTEVQHDLELAQKRHEAEVRQREAQHNLLRGQQHWEGEWQLEIRRRQDAEQRDHLVALRDLGVDLTAYLTQARADQVIEVRGSSGHHVHLEPAATRHGGDGTTGGTAKKAT
jgi:hypothetical protein